MVVVKILGFIDFIASMLFLCTIFSIDLNLQLVIFTGGILFMKSLFILKGDFLSAIDLIASVTLFLGIFIEPWTSLLWSLSLLLMSKAVASFF